MSAAILFRSKAPLQSDEEARTKILPAVPKLLEVSPENQQACELEITEICVRADEVSPCYQSDWHCWGDL